MRGTVRKKYAPDVAHLDSLGDVSRESAEDRRGGKTVWLRREVYVELARCALSAGVPFGAYIENALLKMRAPLPPAAIVALPLAQVSHRLAQISESLDANDDYAVRANLLGARDIIAQALIAIRQECAREAYDRADHIEHGAG
jgi:hypothetical protein